MVTWQQIQKPADTTLKDSDLLALIRDKNKTNSSNGLGMNAGQLGQLLGQLGEGGGDFSSFGNEAAGTATQGISSTSAAPMMRTTNPTMGTGAIEKPMPNTQFREINTRNYANPSSEDNKPKEHKNNWKQETREIASGAMRGAQIGSLAGPWGTAIGAGIGGLLGFFG